MMHLPPSVQRLLADAEPRRGTRTHVERGGILRRRAARLVVTAAPAPAPCCEPAPAETG
jgi:hypothetical protein